MGPHSTLLSALCEEVTFVWWICHKKVINVASCDFLTITNMSNIEQYWYGGDAGCLLPVDGFMGYNYHGPLFTKRTEVLPQDLAKSRSHEIQV